MTLEVILFRKKAKILLTFALFSFLSTLNLVSLVKNDTLHYQCLEKAQSDVF